MDGVEGVAGHIAAGSASDGLQSWRLGGEPVECVCNCEADSLTGSMSPPPMEGSALVAIDGGTTTLLLGGLCREGLERSIASGFAGSDAVYTSGAWVMKLGQGIGPEEIPPLVRNFKHAMEQDTTAASSFLSVWSAHAAQEKSNAVPTNSNPYHQAAAPRTVSRSAFNPLTPAMDAASKMGIEAVGPGSSMASQWQASASAVAPSDPIRSPQGWQQTGMAASGHGWRLLGAGSDEGGGL